MPEITKRQIEAYQLRVSQGLTIQEVGRRMGIVHSTVHVLVRKAKERIKEGYSIRSQKTEVDILPSFLEGVESDKLPILIPDSKSPNTSKSLPTPESENPRFIRNSKRIRQLEGKVNTAELIKMMDDRRVAALVMMDDELLAGSNANQLTQVISGLTDRIQLLKGEPTSITKIEDIRKLDEVAGLLLNEVKRRGILIEGVSETLE